MKEPFSLASVEDIANLSESEELECKAALGKHGNGELPQDFWKTYSAMANTNGGVVLLGVKEVKGAFSVHHLQAIESIKKQLVDIANNPNKVSVNLLTNQHIQTLTVDDCQVLQIIIPRATRQQRPVYLDGNSANSYRRLHEADQLMPADDVKRYLSEQIHETQDDKVLKGYGLADVHGETVRAYRQVFTNRQSQHPWNELDDLSFLKQIGAWRTDRETGEQGLTLAGLLMFGTHPVIQEVRPTYMLDYQERAESSAAPRWIDRITLDGSWSGNLYDFYKRAYKKLTADIKVPFETQQGSRLEETPQHEAIREALCNTLVHADYTGRASVFVVKRPDMFGFRNPGLMRVPLDIAKQGGEPDCRNRLLHQMFRYVGIGDQSGWGIPKILKTWKEHHWRLPNLYEKNDPYDQTRLEMSMIDLFPKGSIDLLKRHFGQLFDDIGYVGQLALAIALTEGTVTHERLKSNADAHSADVSKKLHDLVELGMLERKGANKGSVYYIRGLALPTSDDVFGSSPILEASSPILEASSPILEASSPILAGKMLTKKQRDQDGCVISDLHELSFIDDLSCLSHDVKNKLIEIAKPATDNLRLNKKLTQQIILELCDGHYITISVLSHLLNRQTESLRGSYLSSMVKQGLLKYAFPAEPTDPRQAYTINTEHEHN